MGDGLLRRVRALVDVRFSNSMIDGWWSKLKHQWLFLHRLETAAALPHSEVGPSEGRAHPTARQGKAARFRDLMVDLPDALEEIRSLDLDAIAEFHELLGGDHFREFLAEVIDTFETKGDPSAFWAKWIDVLVARRKMMADGRNVKEV